MKYTVAKSKPRIKPHPFAVKKPRRKKTKKK